MLRDARMSKMAGRTAASGSVVESPLWADSVGLSNRTMADLLYWLNI